MRLQTSVQVIESQLNLFKDRSKLRNLSKAPRMTWLRRRAIKQEINKYQAGKSHLCKQKIIIRLSLQINPMLSESYPLPALILRSSNRYQSLKN